MIEIDELCTKKLVINNLFSRKSTYFEFLIWLFQIYFQENWSKCCCNYKYYVFTNSKKNYLFDKWKYSISEKT